jgi:hypothetical protein
MKMLFFIPECLFILVLVASGFALILGVIDRKTAGKVIGTVLLLAILGPFLDSAFELLPTWVLLLLTGLFLISIFNWVVSSIFGRHTASHLWALLLHDFILMPFRLIGALLRRRF